MVLYTNDLTPALTARKPRTVAPLPVTLDALPGQYLDTYDRHRADGLSHEDAEMLASIDADDSLTAFACSLEVSA